MEAVLSEIVAGLPEKTRLAFPPPEPQQPEEGFRIRVAQPYISPKAKARVMKAIDENTISSGSSVVTEFESALKDFFQVPSAVACSNGYSALLIALKLAGVGADDDVLIPSFTFVAVVNAVIAVDANPVFVDSESVQQLNPSVTQYKQKLTSSTKALIVTHTFGTPANSPEIQKFCKEHNIVMIEDIAEAIGVEINGKLAGTYGDFACSSLYANKVITCGDGGFILSKHQQEDMIETRAKSYCNHGFNALYRFIHFESSGNYKMSGLQAAFVLPAVQEIPSVTKDRSRISKVYRTHLQPAVLAGNLSVISTNRYGIDSPWMFGVLVKSKEIRTMIRQKMMNNGIETRPYFFPLHMQPSVTAYFKVELLADSLPISEYLATHGLCLPTYYGLKEADIINICDCLLNTL